MLLLLYLFLVCTVQAASSILWVYESSSRGFSAFINKGHSIPAGSKTPAFSMVETVMRDDENDPTAISSASTITITVGSDETLAYTLTGTTPVYDNVEAVSSNTSIFTVATSPVSGGTVTLHPVAVGSATLTLTAKNQDGTTAATTFVTVTVENGLYMIRNRVENMGTNGEGQGNGTIGFDGVYYIYPVNENDESQLRLHTTFEPNRVWRMNPSAETTTIQNYATGFYMRHTANQTGPGCIKVDDTDSPSATTYRFKIEPYTSNNNTFYAIKPYQYMNVAPSSNYASFNPANSNSKNIGLWRYSDDQRSLWLYYPVTVTEHDAVLSDFSISGADVLYATGASDAYTHTNTSLTIAYTTYSYNSETHNWYNDTDNGTGTPSAEEVTNQTLYSWSLSDNSYATVDAATGVITVSSLPNGGAVELTLTCTVTSGTSTKTASKTVTLAVYQSPISISASNMSLTVGTDDDLAYTLTTTAGYAPYDLVYATSSNTGLFTVTADAISGGTVTLHPVAVGQATLTLTAKQTDGTTDACSTTATISVYEQVATPVITFTPGSSTTTTITITSATDGASIHYTTDGTDPITNGTLYNGSFTVATSSLPVTIKAYATKSGEYYIASAVVEQEINYGSGTTDDPYILSSASDLAKLATYPSAYFKVGNDFDASSYNGSTVTFTGSLDGALYTISNLTSPLFTTVSGATIKNVILDDVTITAGDGNGDAGAIACSASGATRIYNCGVLATTASSIAGSRYVGSLAGLLDGTSRVINCYSFATVSGGTYRAGIVGYNNIASTNANLATMVMNCMFYGEIDVEAEGSVSPVYGGALITNDGQTGLNNYNYFRFNQDYVQSIDVYNGAIGAEDHYLMRMEFFRYLLNSNRPLAGWYVTGTPDDTYDLMAKWVLDKDIAPCPILKAKDSYPSVVNYDAENAQPIGDASVNYNQGRKLGTLSVTVQMGSGGAPFAAPTGAAITSSSLTLVITDKDTVNYNFNYGKVQLPYYNQVGSGNYTGNRVVTGWKIVSVTGGDKGTFSTEDAFGGYNFADREHWAKDFYGDGGSNRIFNQGAYWEVPTGVTAITIEPYWGKCVYLADSYYDVTYNAGYGNKYDVTTARYTNNTAYTINGSSQTVYTKLDDSDGARTALASNASHTPFDYAIVLVGNFHHKQGNGNSSITGNNWANNNSGADAPYTFMSADLDFDNEPDNCIIYQHGPNRTGVGPIRFDFLSIIDLGLAQKVAGTKYSPTVGIFWNYGWFEVTNTCLIHLQEMEYADNKKVSAPLILQGGMADQISSFQDNGTSSDKTPYILLGGNLYMPQFSNGAHPNKPGVFTPHTPISVTGGDFDKFYLSGQYTNTATDADNAECYIDGGRFGELAGASMQGIQGDVSWSIYNADIHSFYGGGINAGKPITGNITTTIKDSRVGVFCGGPKFGDMTAGKAVTTTASGCLFGTFFGAGYGGTSILREFGATENNNVTSESSDDYFNGKAYSRDYTNDKGIAIGYEYEFFQYAGTCSLKNVARYYINYASLSLAKTHNVVSTLTGCTVKNDFYGGGNLGAVDGNVTSTLTNCVVEGSVFGAGFSATAPTADVLPSKSTNPPVNPYLNGDAGVFVDAVYPDAEPYTWTYTSTTVSASNDIDDENKLIYTNVNPDGLGKVTGDIDLTVNGSTVVKGSVFGGGNAAAVVGDTEVKILQTPRIYNSVYGGGNQGEVDGDTKVIVNSTVSE